MIFLSSVKFNMDDNYPRKNSILTANNKKQNPDRTMGIAFNHSPRWSLSFNMKFSPQSPTFIFRETENNNSFFSETQKFFNTFLKK